MVLGDVGASCHTGFLHQVLTCKQLMGCASEQLPDSCLGLQASSTACLQDVLEWIYAAPPEWGMHYLPNPSTLNQELVAGVINFSAVMSISARCLHEQRPCHARVGFDTTAARIMYTWMASSCPRTRVPA